MKTDYDTDTSAYKYGGELTIPDTASVAQYRAFDKAMKEVNPAEIYEKIFDEPYPTEEVVEKDEEKEGIV